jgi:hypothetical protein
MASIEAWAPRAPMAVRAAWREVCVPACRGLLAHARGNDGAAARVLEPIIARMPEIGGSHAQRALFELILADAARQSRATAG